VRANNKLGETTPFKAVSYRSVNYILVIDHTWEDGKLVLLNGKGERLPLSAKLVKLKFFRGETQKNSRGELYVPQFAFKEKRKR
jgi:hypothetical protein